LEDTVRRASVSLVGSLCVNEGGDKGSAELMTQGVSSLGRPRDRVLEEEGMPQGNIEREKLRCDSVEVLRKEVPTNRNLCQSASGITLQYGAEGHPHYLLQCELPFEPRHHVLEKSSR